MRPIFLTAALTPAPPFPVVLNRASVPPVPSFTLVSLCFTSHCDDFVLTIYDSVSSSLPCALLSATNEAPTREVNVYGGDERNSYSADDQLRHRREGLERSFGFVVCALVDDDSSKAYEHSLFRYTFLKIVITRAPLPSDIRGRPESPSYSWHQGPTCRAMTTFGAR